MPRVIKQETFYTIDWCTAEGTCYRTTRNVPRHALKECRAIAKALGDKIIIADKEVRKYDYSY